MVAKVSKQLTLTIPTYQLYNGHLKRITKNPAVSKFPSQTGKKTFQDNNPIPTAEFPFMNEPITSASAKSLQHHLVMTHPPNLQKKHLAISLFLVGCILQWFSCHWIPSRWPPYPNLHQLQELWRWLKSCEEGLPLLSSAKTGGKNYMSGQVE